MTFDGSAVRVSDDGVFLLGFGRDAPSKARLSAEFPDGSRTHRDLRVAQRSYDVQRVDGLPPGKVSPSEEDMVRIRRDIALVKKARARDDPREDFPGGIPVAREGSHQRRLRQPKEFSMGSPGDRISASMWRAPVGAIVRAPADGVVTLAHDDMFFSGGTLIVDYGHGLSSSFLHLSAILVNEGDRIRQGDPIAKVGATGRVSGPHLDWRMNLFGNRLDPQLLVGPMEPQ